MDHALLVTLTGLLAQASEEETPLDPMVMGAIIAIGTVVVGTFSAWALWTRAHRSRSLPEVARRSGLSFSESDPFDCARVAFPLFRAGDVRRVEHVMWNPESGSRVFDYAYAVEYRDENGKVSYRWYTFTCATIRHDGRWPEIRLLRERLFDRALQRIGLPDIDLESEEFNRMFLVQCEDARFATDLLSPQMMDFLLGTDGKVSIETKGRELLVTSRRIDAELFPGLLGVADGFVRHVPPLVWDLYGRYPQGGAAPVTDTWLAAERDARAAEPDPTTLLGPSSGTSRRQRGPMSPGAGFGYGVSQAGVWRGSWEAERIDARRRATEPEDKVEYDLDGNPVGERTEDPWGDGRTAPTGDFDLDGNPIDEIDHDPWRDAPPSR